MLLQGSIRRFDLAGVLQFLAQDAATGVLEVRDFEEYGFIYLVDGRVEGISLPSPMRSWARVSSGPAASANSSSPRRSSRMPPSRTTRRSSNRSGSA